MTTKIICPIPLDLEWHQNELRDLVPSIDHMDEIFQYFESVIASGKTPCEALEQTIEHWHLDPSIV